MISNINPLVPLVILLAVVFILRKKIIMYVKTRTYDFWYIILNEG